MNTETAVKLNTFADIMALPYDPSLMGPRTRGSTTERGLANVLPESPIVEFRPTVGNVPVARYFTFDASALGGKLGAVPFGSLSPEEHANVRTRFVNEAHGIEFYFDRAPETVALPEAREGVVILGPVDDKGTLGVWTWYVCNGPETRVLGCLLARKQATDHPAASLAVKLHNGK
jgi:hypothetical protein